MSDREKVIGLLQEMAEYFRECRNNASFGSKAENHFWELQNAANEAVKLLKEQEGKMEHLNNITLEYEKEVFRLQALLKEQENEYENGFNDAMLGKQGLMYEGTDGKWHRKDW